MNREKNFSFNIWDIDVRVSEVAEESKMLEQGDLQMIAGGKMNNKFLAPSLAALSLLTSMGITTNVKATPAASPTVYVSDVQKSEQDNQEIQYLTKQQVIEDIDYMMSIVKKDHFSCVNEIPKEVLDQKELEIQNLSENTSLIEEWRIISRILVKLHDGHSFVLAPKCLNNKRLPFDVEYSDNKLFCTSGEFKGAEITEINGVKLLDIYENFKLHYSHEIEEWTNVNFFRCKPFITQSNLALSGIDTFNPVEVSFKTNTGIVKNKFKFIEDKSRTEIPFFSYEIDKKNNVGIFNLNRFRYTEEYKTTVDNFFEEIAKNNIKNVVVDLRRNPGGGGVDSAVYCFLRYLKNLESFSMCKSEVRVGNEIKTFEPRTYTFDEILPLKSTKNLFDGKIFILTSNATFSAAALFTEYFADNNLATIVGEVPGNSPTAFGGFFSTNYITPNSKLHIYTTHRKKYRTDSTKDPDRLIPDVQVSAKDALNKVYEIIEKDNGKS